MKRRMAQIMALAMASTMLIGCGGKTETPDSAAPADTEGGG